MKLKYETGVATFIQFIIASLFVLATQFGSATVGCFKNSHDCVSNIIVSILFFIVVSFTFGFIWFVGYFAQERRSRRMAQLLIAIQGMFGLLALFSIKLNLHSHNIFGLLGSLGLLAMSVWIISLAFRLMGSGGGRVVVKQRGRARRRRPTTNQ